MMQALTGTAQEDVRRLIGLVISRDLYLGDDLGYCILITKDAIIGARRPESLGDDFGVYLGSGGETTADALAKVNKMAEMITRTRRFLISARSIDQIVMRKPGFFLGGYVIIRTKTRILRIDMRLLSVGGQELSEASNILAESLDTLVGGRFCTTRSPFPLVIDWPWASQSRLIREKHLGSILRVLEEHKEGLSNAEIDTTLSNYSQWTTARHIRELTEMGLIEYKLELFGNPGKYFITAPGISALKEMAT